MRRQLTADEIPAAVAALVARCERDEETGCLIDPTATRYAEARIGNARTSGHRAVYVNTHGPIPDGMVVRHDCDRPQCVEVEHLRLGSESENVRDSFDRDRRGGRVLPLGSARPFAVLDEATVTTLRRRVRGGETIKDVCSELGLAYSSARSAVRGMTWKHVEEPPIPNGYAWSRSNARALDDETVERARALYDDGLSLAEVAVACGISRATAFNYCSHTRREAAS